MCSSQPARPVIAVHDGRLEARWPSEKPGTGVAVDFASMRFPSGPTSVFSMPLVRACGVALARAGGTLIDATAGLGYDAFVLARAGFRVTALERSPDVARLLIDGLRRAGDPFELIEGDAKEIIASRRPAVVYLDPMYPPKKRASALPPKDMQIVRALVGDDADAGDVFELARRRAGERVVVKRPIHAEPFGAPTATIAGKLARFDIYVRAESGHRDAR